MKTRPTLFGTALVALAIAHPVAAQTSPPTIDERELVRRVTSLLDSLSRRDEFAGVVAIAHNGATVFEHAYGYADREAKTPNTVTTAFNLGSINKNFTETAIRQLAAAGKLSPDSTLATYWPDYPNADVAKQITIRQLMQHRSGIGGNIFGTPASGRRHDVMKLADFLPLFVAEPLQFAPGTKEQYSNAGFVVLGLLIERLSGEDYYAYVKRHIYEPAGMTRTEHFAADALPPETAIGYTRRANGPNAPPDAPLTRNTALLPGRGSSAGGGYSTAQDMLRYVAALRARRIPNGPFPGIGIAGGSQGLNAALEGDLPGGYDLVVMANMDPPIAEKVARLIREMLGAKD